MSVPWLDAARNLMTILSPVQALFECLTLTSGAKYTHTEVINASEDSEKGE